MKKRKDNGGFSLIELIITVTIMGILVGMIGCLVIPYIEHARIGKDQQELSSVLANSVTAFAIDGVQVNDGEYIELTPPSNHNDPWSVTSGTVDSTVINTFKSLHGDDIKITSSVGGTITSIKVSYLQDSGTIELITNATGADGKKLYNSKTYALSDAVSEPGRANRT